MQAIPLFYGRKDGREDPLEYLEAFNYSIEEKYTGNKAVLSTRIVFRVRLHDDVLEWYQDLDTAVRYNWTKLSGEFSVEYQLEHRAAVDTNQFFTQLCNRGEKHIAQYVTEAEELYRKCPEALKAYMGSQFESGSTVGRMKQKM